MRIFLTGSPICFVVVILLMISPDSSVADLCEHIESQDSAQTKVPEIIPSAVVMPVLFETSMLSESESELVGNPVIVPAVAEEPFGSSSVEHVVFMQNLNRKSDAPEKITVHSSMPMMGNQTRQISLQPHRIVSYETVDRVFDKNSLESTDFEFGKSQLGGLMLNAGNDDRAKEILQSTSPSAQTTSTGPMIWIFLGIIAVSIAGLRRVRMSL